MAQVLLAFDELVVGTQGAAYRPHACARQRAEDGKWEAWLEFVPLETGAVLRTGRETTQPSLEDSLHWADGLTKVYLEGALDRALAPIRILVAASAEAPAYDGPAPFGSPASAVLNPYAVGKKGAPLLRIELEALEARHLRDIIRAYCLVDERRLDLEDLSHAELVELILGAACGRPAGRRSARSRRLARRA